MLKASATKPRKKSESRKKEQKDPRGIFFYYRRGDKGVNNIRSGN